MIKILILSFAFLNLTASCLECNRFNSNLKHVFGTKSNYDASLNYFNSTSLLNLNFVPDNCKTRLMD